MTDTQRPLQERVREAIVAAQSGLGKEDLVVRYHLSIETAWRIVREEHLRAAARRAAGM